MMDADTYRASNLQLAACCEILESLPLHDMLRAQASAESVGPLVDPTLYRAKAKAFRLDMERTRIMRKAQASLAKLREEHGK